MTCHYNECKYEHFNVEVYTKKVTINGRLDATKFDDGWCIEIAWEYDRQLGCWYSRACCFIPHYQLMLLINEALAPVQHAWPEECV